MNQGLSLRPRRASWLPLALVSLCALGAAARAAEAPPAIEDDGRTMSFNSEVKAVPAPGPVTIDGKEDDWDLSAGVWCYNDPVVARKLSVWVQLMWDAKGVYLLARYHDPSPLQNSTQGKDFGKSWQADCYQARVIFDEGTPDEHQMHVNMFYSTPEKTPYMLVKHGGFRPQAPFDETGPDRADLAERFGNTMDKAGGTVAFRPWADGKGYNLEAFWPWKYCRLSGQPLAAGESFVFGIEAMWGNADGTSLGHRLADGIQNEKVNRIFMFRARRGWGRAVLSAQGHLDVTAAQEALHALRLKRFEDFSTAGSVPIAYTLDAARDVTIAIDNADGVRVRNLFGQYPREPGKITDYWDGLDDAAKPVAPGAYTATVVDHAPVTLAFFNSCFNAATPPWPTEAGSRLWGSNHGHPMTAAARGDVTLIGFTGTEGGSGLVRVDANDRILWTDKNEIYDVTIGAEYAYTFSVDSFASLALVRRLRLSDGQIIPFLDANHSPHAVVREGRAALAAIPLASSIAWFQDRLYILLPGEKLYRMHPETGAVEATQDAGVLQAVTDRGGKLYGLTTAGAIGLLDADGKMTATLLQANGVAKPVRLGISQDATRFAVSDAATNQVRAFDAKGAELFVLGLARAEAGRPAGTFVETDLTRPMGLDFDAQGRLWLAEASPSTRRVTCWDAQGKLQKSFWGGADYGAMSGFAVTFDSTRFIAHGIEFQLDPAPDPWKRPTAERPLRWHPELYPARGFVYAYKGHEYAVTFPGYNGPGNATCIIAKRAADGVFRTCVRIEWSGRHQVNGQWVDAPGRAWIDRNDNGQEDPGEITEGVRGRTHYWSGGWCRPDLAIITNDFLVYEPKEFTPAGVPLYDFANPVRSPHALTTDLAAQGSTGTVVMDAKGGVSTGIAFSAADGHRGSYPNPYGRHDAPAAQRGLLIAPFRTNGVVEGVPGVGSITALSGDRGEWFILSMDGLYLASICQDTKGEVTLDETFIGQESFGGFFWRDEKGRILVQLGGPSYRLMEVRGLESCRKRTVALTVTAAQIAQGAQLVAARQNRAGREPEELAIVRVAALPDKPVAPELAPGEPLIPGVVDFAVREPGNPKQTWRAAVAHDGTTLALMFQVADPSPWKNGEARFTHAFIGGDCVDFQLSVPNRGELRLLAAPLAGKDTAVLWQKKASQKDGAFTYAVGNNPANAAGFDVVRLCPAAKVQSARGMAGYSVLITVPLAELSLDPARKTTIRGVLGVIYSDPSGTNRAARLYWHDKQTGLVSDVPSEARLNSTRWGKLTLE